VQETRVWRALLGLKNTVVEGVEFDEDAGVVVVHARPTASRRSRCGTCGRRSPGFDQGDGRRRWRALDLGTVQAFVEADAPRVRCRRHQVTVAAVPWARHDAGHTRDFDDTVAWLATITSKTAVTRLMRVAWRTVGSIITRVWADTGGATDRLAGLARIGIDEISYRRGQQYLTVVVDHDSGRLVWAAPGNTAATLRSFFDALGPARSAAITHVSADGADWIAVVVAERIPDAVVCADAFHVVQWATAALDQVRIEAWRTARAAARTEPKRGRGAPRKDAPPRPASTLARGIQRSRYALWKNPEDLTERQHAKLAWIATTDPKLYRAYLLKEGLRTIFQLPYDDAVEALDLWLGWARRCRIPAFTKLARSVKKFRDMILNAIAHRLSNSLIESVNAKIRLITRIAFGFKNVDALIALAMLSLGGHRPALPGRN
jgi:transposase